MKNIISINRNTDFKRLYSRGKSCPTSSLVIYTSRNKTENRRLGITVSKKIGKAVIRNRAKRRLRELYRLNEKNLKNGIDIILVARARCAFVPFKKLESDFQFAANKLNIFKNNENIVD